MTRYTNNDRKIWNILFKFKDVREAEKAEAVVSITINVALWVIRLIAGILLNSIALITDAWHGLSDALTSLGVLIFSKIASKPPDKEHPFGHGRAADLGSFLIGIMLFIIGFYFLYDGIQGLMTEREIVYSYLGLSLIVTVITIFIKIFNYFYAQKLGKDYNSNLCKTDALHHKLDALVTAVVVVGLSMYYFFNIPKMDSILTIFVSLLIIYEGGETVYGIANILMDKNFEDISEEIKSILKEFKDIEKISDIRVRSVGSYYYVELNISLKKDMKLSRAHEISDKVEDELKKRIPQILEVHIHEEPL
ncbi:cation diffusion facilitator family transporter [Fervidicoccus fontis]|uniref:Cation transporter n=1 Tax=Fervidicoccus fontis TaxID=683846 RepID=A0A7C2VAB4_9CREN|nr:cation diffusion facilitator family transporter [Fervidicoccus fontis]PMB76987.1 MAG: hypothetical protein C0177_04570 [Fervidicoccus fontis]HEW63804.1 cation transporter [Fervidicoccus fontis]